MAAMCFSETSVDFHGLHGVVSQETELFIAVYCENFKPNITRTFITVFRTPTIEP
jgi:hypothetical protein